MHIKICGITNLEDAMAAAAGGADHLGFNFYPKSPRCVSAETCERIIAAVRRQHPGVTMVGVFVNSPVEEMAAVAWQCKLDMIQLSGDEATATVVGLAARRIPAFKVVRASMDRERIALYAGMNAQKPALLLDSSAPGQFGGSGQTADWEWAAAIAREYPVFLAGGLTPENLDAAIRKVNPWGVDAASGVESAPGWKDRGKMAVFLTTAQQTTGADTLRIEPAGSEDAAEILALQKLAYHSEAELNQEYSIPPLTQTLPEIEAEFGRKVFLKAKSGGEIIGSVRAEMDDGTCLIGRLIVHPGLQNRGIGSRLLKAMEDHFPEAARYELFTSERSERNLHLYQKSGYKVFQRERLNDRVMLVYLEKNRTEPQT